MNLVDRVIGDLGYLEALNSETIANAMNRLVAMKVLHKVKSDGSFLVLTPAYQFSSTCFQGNCYDSLKTTELWKLTEKVGTFRREGKHRRDNDSTGLRVLRLAKLKRQKLNTEIKAAWRLDKPRASL